MNRFTLLALLLAPLLFLGCSSTSPLSIEEHGSTIAQSIGSEVAELKYVSPGDFAAFEELGDGFNQRTKGVVALTESSLFWRDGQGGFTSTNTFREIPLDTVTGAALDDGVIQLRIGNHLHVLRLTEWNPFQPSPRKTQELLQILRSQNISTFAVHASVPKFPVDRPPFSRQEPKFTGYIPVVDGDGYWTVRPTDASRPR